MTSKFENPTLEREELIRRLNGWLELGEEMQRIVHFMGNVTKEDLLPDWFETRLAAFVTTETIERRNSKRPSETPTQET